MLFVQKVVSFGIMKVTLASIDPVQYQRIYRINDTSNECISHLPYLRDIKYRRHD